MLEGLLTTVSVLFGLAYLWLKAGDAIRAAWASLLAWRSERAITSSAAGVPASPQNEPERRSYAVERDREPLGTLSPEQVPAMVPTYEIPELLAQLDDMRWVELLALIPGEKGGYRFSDSQIAKFIPGRNAEWMQVVRELRAKPEPEPPRTPIAGRAYDPSKYRPA